MTIINNLVQGTSEWEQFRLTHYGASEAAAMLGMSPKVKRNELLRMKHTGNPKQFSEWLQKNVLDKGHAVEALARPHVEKIVGQKLYPVVCEDMMLSASCDGLTMDESIAFEHKQWNAEQAFVVRDGAVPEEHMPQCQQILLVTKADKLLFVMSDGTPGKMLYVWVTPDPAWFARLREGWEQFDRDRASYELPAETQAAPVGHSPEALPALLIEVTGEVTASNLQEYKKVALARFKAINRDLVTEEDFADATATVKWCENIELRLKAAKEHALSKTESIEQLFNTFRELEEESARTRVELSKLIDKRRLEIKEGILVKARGVFTDHVEALKAELEGLSFDIPWPNLAEAAKNKRTIASLQNAVDTAVANGKVSADGLARTVRTNLALLKTDGAGFEFLFADRQTLVQKQPDDLKLLITSRIQAHKDADEKRLEDERQKIRVEETAKLAIAPSAVVTDVESRPVLPTVTAAPRSGGGGGVPTLRLGVIGTRLGFVVSAEFLGAFGFRAAKERTSTLYQESDFPQICEAIAAHVKKIGAQPW